MHGFSDKNSGSVNSNIHDLSEEGDLVSGNNKSISSGEHDVLSKEQLEAAKKSEDSSGLERSAICLMISVIPLHMVYVITTIPVVRCRSVFTQLELLCVSPMLEL